MLLGAHAEGVRNILAITGDPPEVGDYPGSRGVYEIDAIGLTRLITGLNRGEDFNGRPIDAPTSFFVGVAVNPTADDLELEAERFRQKLEAGAKFAMTQIVFDLDALDRFAEAVGGWPIPVLAGIFPVTSYRLALRLHNEVPGIVVPQELQDALEDAGAGAAEVGHGARARAARRRARALRGRLRRRAVPPADAPCSSCSARTRRSRAMRLRGSRLRGLSPSRSRNSFGGDDRVQLLDHLRVPHLLAHLRLVGDLHRDRAAGPDEREAEDGAEHGAADRVEQPQRRQQPQPAADERADEARERAAAAPRRRARRRSRPARCSSTRSRRAEACGARLRPDERPGDEPGEREQRRHEPAAEPAERRQRHEADEDPVECRHAAPSSPCGYTALRPGA